MSPTITSYQLIVQKKKKKKKKKAKLNNYKLIPITNDHVSKIRCQLRGQSGLQCT